MKNNGEHAVWEYDGGEGTFPQPDKMTTFKRRDLELFRNGGELLMPETQ